MVDMKDLQKALDEFYNKLKEYGTETDDEKMLINVVRADFDIHIRPMFSAFQELSFCGKEPSLRKTTEIIKKMQQAINEKIEQRLIVISQKGRIRYFSWDEAFLSQKDAKRVFDETFAKSFKGSVEAQK